MNIHNSLPGLSSSFSSENPKNSNTAAMSKALSGTHHGSILLCPTRGKNMDFPLGSASSTSERWQEGSWTQQWELQRPSQHILHFSEILQLS